MLFFLSLWLVALSVASSPSLSFDESPISSSGGLSKFDSLAFSNWSQIVSLNNINSNINFQFNQNQNQNQNQIQNQIQNQFQQFQIQFNQIQIPKNQIQNQIQLINSNLKEEIISNLWPAILEVSLTVVSIIYYFNFNSILKNFKTLDYFGGGLWNFYPSQWISAALSYFNCFSSRSVDNLDEFKNKKEINQELKLNYSTQVLVFV